VRPIDGVLGQLPDALAEAWRSGDRDGLTAAVDAASASDPQVAFLVAKITEQWPGSTVADVLDRLAAWDLEPILDGVRGPVLVADPEAAGAFPGQSAELAKLLGDRAHRVAFTSGEGAGLDCEVGAAALRAQRLGDWLDEVVPQG
jgi:hypothetical protein